MFLLRAAQPSQQGPGKRRCGQPPDSPAEEAQISYGREELRAPAAAPGLGEDPQVGAAGDHAQVALTDVDEQKTSGGERSHLVVVARLVEDREGGRPVAGADRGSLELKRRRTRAPPGGAIVVDEGVAAKGPPVAVGLGM
jgi:hypothetical protein